MSLTESPSLTIFPQEFTAMDEPIADYNRLLPVAIARAVLEAAGKGTEMAAHLSPQPFPLQRSSQSGPCGQGFASPRPTTACP